MKKKILKKNVKSRFLCLAYPCQMHPAAWLLSTQGSSEQVNRVGTDGQELGPGRWTGLRGRSRSSGKGSDPDPLGGLDCARSCLVLRLGLRIFTMAELDPTPRYPPASPPSPSLCLGPSVLATWALPLCGISRHVFFSGLLRPALSLLAQPLHRRLCINVTSPTWHFWTNSFKIASHPTRLFPSSYSAFFISL